MNKLKNLFVFHKYNTLGVNDSYLISIFPNIDMCKTNYYSCVIYELHLYWLCFGCGFKLTRYKNN